MATVSEIPRGGMALCVHENKFIMLAKVNDEIYAIDDICMHQEASLHEEELGAQKNNSDLVICPWHAVHFDLRRGNILQGKQWTIDTETYEVKVQGDNVYLNFER